MTRKGSTSDLFAIIKVLLPLPVALFILGTFFFKFFSHVENIQFLQPYLFFLDPFYEAVLVFDFLAPLIYLGLLGGSVFLASRINASPVYLPVSIIMGLFAIVLATQFQNMSLEFAGLDLIASYTSKFPLTEAMLIHFNKLIAVAWILIVSVMYKNNYGRGGAANPIR
jgi:hypothetical protein